VVEADNGAVAIRLLRGGLRPALILIDLSMPIMDGRAFRAEQTADPMLPEIPTVVMTGSPVDLAALGRALGVRVMAKPVDWDDLLALAGRHCARAA
jgi:CheY-like chemotaxis protein